MGFSLVGFGAGLAESAVEKIEEERKFSNLALQGRIERASVLKMQREKEAQAIEKDLSERLDTLKQMGIEDKDLQKAYLSAPIAFEALQKAKISGVDVDPTQLIKINKEKLFSGTPDEMIKAASRSTQQVTPARVLPVEGRDGLLSPSIDAQQRRLEQFASARGMSLEDVARAESATAPSRPEVAASINFDALKKEDKTTWKQKLERYETNYADTVQKFGADSPEAIKAKAAVDSYRVTTSNMTEDQYSHAKKLDRAYAIMYDKTLSTATEQDRKWAESYLREYEAYKRRQEAAGKDDEKIPTATSLVNIGRTAGANAISIAYGTSAIKDNLVFTDNADGSTSVKYTGRDQAAQQRIIRRQQEAVIASMKMYMPDGKVQDKKVEQALSAFGIKLNEQRRPVPIDAPDELPPKKAPSLPTRTPVAGRGAGMGGATTTPAPTPSAQPKEGDRSKSKSGKDIIYRNGQWEYL